MVKQSNFALMKNQISGRSLCTTKERANQVDAILSILKNLIKTKIRCATCQPQKIKDIFTC